MNISSLAKLGITVGAVAMLGACATTPGEWPMKPGATGTATPGHLRDSGNKPVRTSNNECVNLGYSSGPGHPKGKPGDCTVQPPPPPPAPAAAPAPQRAAPAPAPAPAPKQVKQKVTLQAEALFDFDKAVLKPSGKAAIDQALATRSKENLSVDTVLVSGHTDSIGTDAYNDKLSLRRAQAVKDYMVSKGVESGKITVEGKGERQPEASNKTKQGRAQNRRVEIEFSGSEIVTIK